jgi:hypothetical protein
MANIPRATSQIASARAGKRFRLSLDDAEGVAVRTCVGCHPEHPIGDGDACLEDAELEECACPCGRDVSLYEAAKTSADSTSAAIAPRAG